MRRYLSAAFAILSFLAALAVAFFLLESYFQLAFLPLHLPLVCLLIRSYDGILATSFFSLADWLPTFDDTPNWSFTFLGFGLDSHTGLSGFSIITLYLPHWFTLALLLIHPILWLRRTQFWLNRGRQRRMAGLCPHCGYDLRAHLQNTHQPTHPTDPSEPESPANPITSRAGKNCPECGTPVLTQIR